MREAEKVDSESLQGVNEGGGVGVALRDAPAQTSPQPTPEPAEPPATPPADTPPPHLAKARSRVSIYTKLPVEDPPPCPATTEQQEAVLEVDAVLEVEAELVDYKKTRTVTESKDNDPRFWAVNPATGERIRVRDDKGKILPGDASYVVRGVAPGTPPPGRPKHSSDKSKQLRKQEAERFSRRLREMLRKQMIVKVNGKETQMTWQEAISQQMAAMATSGNVAAIKQLLEYAYGPPPQRTEISGPDGGALRVVFPQQFEGV